jgi:CheY-like chemotaxis protein
VKSATSGPTILVVEPDQLLRNGFSRFLEEHGCTVLEARSGEEAAALLSEGTYVDVFFTAIRLGGRLTGWDVARIAQHANTHVRLIYTSEHDDFPRRDHGGSVFIKKPYDPGAVLGVCLASRT